MSKLVKILFFLFLICNNSYSEDIKSLMMSVNNLENIPPHCGIRISIFYKEDGIYTSKTEMKFKKFSKFKMTTIEPETQRGNIVGSDGENLIMYMPKYRLKSLTPLSSFGKEDEGKPRGRGTGIILDFDIDKLFKNYDVKLNKDSENYIISLTSKRKPPHQRKIWINKNKKLIVREERYFAGKLYYKFYYENLEFRTPLDSELEIKIPPLTFSFPSFKKEDTVFNSLAEAKNNLKNFSFPKNLPEGFEFVYCKVSKEGGETVSLKYSDGLLNIFIQKRETKGLEKIIKLFGGEEVLKEIRNFNIVNSYDEKTEKETITISGEFPVSLLKNFLK
jgi:outer membrane lipoprotein-sorting protein